jgi:serine/threonine protein kinase
MRRTVAVKVLPASMTKNKEAIKRFQREVVAAAQLEHPNVVGALDADEIDGKHLFVMQFVDGRDLSAVFKKNGPLAVDQAIDCIVQAARGLEYAHGRGVIHRDIKPANLLLDSSGTVKILDMGLARFSDAADVGAQAELTHTGQIMGTVDYMSPEQAVNTKTADARADIYSLGISLYFLLTGNPPYQAETLTARLLAHQNDPIPVLSQVRADVPPTLDAVFAKMIAKSAEQRYQSMTAAARVTGGDGFTNFLQSLDADDATTPNRSRTRRPASATQGDSSSQGSLGGGFDFELFVETLKAPENRKRVIGGGVGGVLLLGLLIWTFSGGEKSPNEDGSNRGKETIIKVDPKAPPLTRAPFTTAKAKAHQEE